MKRLITSLTILLLLLSVIQAQTLSQYEYWTDDNYNGRVTVEATSGEVMLSINTATQASGIHYLNFRALRSDGVWGNYCRYLYYIPRQTIASEGSVSVEYWLDDNRANYKNIDATDNQLSLTIDISQLSPGVHFFNCTAIRSDGERGNSERYLFYVPRPIEHNTVAELAGFEYWIDDNCQEKTVCRSSEAQPMLVVNIDGLTSGVHYFNCRPVNERGEYGNPIRKMFYIPDNSPVGGATLAAAEYWLNDDYANKVRLQTSDTQQAFTIDISALSSGVHYFNYRAIDSEGRLGNPIRQLFYIARKTDMVSGERITYEYWIDDDLTSKVTGEGSLSQYVFNIDISKLRLGSHTFNFRAQYTFGEWSEPFTAEFIKTTGKCDVNGDGYVDVADIATIICVMVGERLEYSEAADVNDDGVVDVADIATVISHMAKNARLEKQTEELTVPSD